MILWRFHTAHYVELAFGIRECLDTLRRDENG